MKKVYIAGKVAGNPNFREDFAKAEKYLREECGVEPVNPVDGVEDGHPHEEYMHRDLQLLLQCDYIYLLPNWRESRGAKLEQIVAKECGIERLGGDYKDFLKKIMGLKKNERDTF